eukprot:TRINITY_DN29022_c0_g1_i1.p1 TRINITY_DN29022_c0_g1~~TRINITY_DN29022_c0_g1_i1.p1  ORF type:complete len:211 (+),score=21.19 TRINITY_DN29022_c0_g1_i1:160-792(+)
MAAPRPSLETVLLELAALALVAVVVLVLYASQGFRPIWYKSSLEVNVALLVGQAMVAYIAMRLACVAAGKAAKAAQEGSAAQKWGIVAAAVVPGLAMLYVIASSVAQSAAWRQLKEHPVVKWAVQNARERGASDVGFCLRLVVLLIVYQVVAWGILSAFKLLRWQVKVVSDGIFGVDDAQENGQEKSTPADSPSDLPLSPHNGEVVDSED